MKLKLLKNSAWAIVIFLIAHAQGARADSRASINVSAPDGRVVIYWSNANVYTGQTLDVTREGAAVGVVLVTEVSAFYVQGRLISGAAAEGDLVHAPPAKPTVLEPAGPAPPAPADKFKKKLTPATITAPDPQPEPPKKTAPEEPLVKKPKPEPKPEPEPEPKPKPAEAPAPVENKKTKRAGAGKGVSYAIGGGVYAPSGEFLEGETGVVTMAGYLNLGRYQGSLSYSVATPGFESETTGAAYKQSVDLVRTHLSLATAPRDGLLPALQWGLGYTYTQFKYELCTVLCGSLTGETHGPHALIRASFTTPLRLIAEARYTWDADAGIQGAGTGGFELALLLPFEL
jgi:hypothetical protein